MRKRASRTGLLLAAAGVLLTPLAAASPPAADVPALVAAGAGVGHLSGGAR